MNERIHLAVAAAAAAAGEEEEEEEVGTLEREGLNRAAVATGERRQEMTPSLRLVSWLSPSSNCTVFIASDYQGGGLMIFVRELLTVDCW